MVGNSLREDSAMQMQKRTTVSYLRGGIIVDSGKGVREDLHGRSGDAIRLSTQDTHRDENYDMTLIKVKVNG